MMDKTANRMENGRPGGAARSGGLARAGLLLALAAALAWPALGGSLDAPAAPNNSGSAMYTLLQIWTRLTTNVVPAQKRAVMTAFGEPAGPPTSGTGKTLDDVFAVALPTQVPKSGQTTSYVAGDDGDLEKGVAWPGTRFTDNGNGTVTDNLTGLIWLKNANCGGAMTWAAALTYCNTLSTGSCGLSDGSTAGQWRLPNRRELLSLIDDEKLNPALPSGHPFTNVGSNYYWSSATYAGATDYAWYVHLGEGFVEYSNKAAKYSVWPVRGGQ